MCDSIFLWSTFHNRAPERYKFCGHSSADLVFKLIPGMTDFEVKTKIHTTKSSTFSYIYIYIYIARAGEAKNIKYLRKLLRGTNDGVQQ